MLNIVPFTKFIPLHRHSNLINQERRRIIITVLSLIKDPRLF